MFDGSHCEPLPADVAGAMGRIYSAGFEPGLWRDGLAGLCRAVGAYAAVTVPRVAAENSVLLPCTAEVDEFIQAYVRETTRALLAPIADVGLT